MTDPFERFWNVYPRKVNRAMALGKWKIAIEGGVTRTLDKDAGEHVVIEHPGTDPADIITAAALYARQTVNDDMQYVLHPTTWFNRGRYMDFSDIEIANYRREQQRREDEVRANRDAVQRSRQKWGLG